MAQSAYITLVDGSTSEHIALDQVKELLLHYRGQVALTGSQLAWEYENAAFPYTITEKPGEEWFYLKGTEPQYKYILFGTGTSEADGGMARNHIQVALPDDATHGDKAKANELCKYIAKRLQAELRLFNGRTIYYNPRK